MKRLLHLVPACLLVWGLSVSGDAHYKDGDAWRIVEAEPGSYEFVLENVQDKELRHPVELVSWSWSRPRYLGHLPVEKDGMVLLVYHAGTAGSQLIAVYRAIVFNTRTRKFYGDFPFRVDGYSPAVFSFGESSFTVIFRPEGLNVTVDY